MRIPEGACPCGSDKPAVDCCYQMRPPIQREPELQVNALRLNTSVQFVDMFGLPVSPKIRANTRGTLKVSDLLFAEDSIYQPIKVAHKNIARRLPPFANFATQSEKDKTLFERTLLRRLDWKDSKNKNDVR